MSVINSLRYPKSPREGTRNSIRTRSELEKGEKALNNGKYQASVAFGDAKTQLDQTKEELTAAIATMEEQRAELVAQQEAAASQRQMLTALQQSIALLERSQAVLEGTIAEIQGNESLTEEERAAALTLP